MSLLRFSTRSRLQKAVMFGQVNKVRDIIRFNALTNQEGWLNSEAYELLITAIYLNEPRIAELLLSVGCSTNSDSLGITQTPLHYAMRKGNVSLIKNLLEKGALIDARGERGYTALHLAVKAGHVRVVELLLMQGASVHICDDKNYSPLHDAAKKSVKVVSLLLKFGALVDKKSNDASMPLHLAAQCGKVEVVQLLASKGAPLDALNDKDETALKLALQNKHKKVVSLLLNLGTSRYNLTSDSALHLAAQECNIFRVKSLLMKNVDVNLTTVKNNFTAIYIAVKNRDAQMCKALLKAGADANICDSDGRSPLLVAARGNDFRVAEMLLQFHANVNLSAKDNSTPLYISAVMGYEALFMHLLENGAEKWTSNVKIDNETILGHVADKGHAHIALYILKRFDIPEKTFKTCLKRALGNSHPSCNKIIKHFVDEGYFTDDDIMNDFEIVSAVIRNGHFEIMKEMLTNGLNLNARLAPNFVYRPLSLALDSKQKNILELLISHGAEIDFDDKISPLFSVLDYEGYFDTDSSVYKSTPNYDIFSMFLTWGASVDRKNDKGQTLLHVAVSKGDLKIVKLLLQHSVNVHSEDNCGMTALHLAAIEGRMNIFNLLLKNGFDINVAHRNKCTLVDLMETGHRATRVMTKSLQQHIIKMKTADFFLKETHLNLPLDLVAPDFQEKCAAELSAMKKDEVSDSGVTFYDILLHSLTLIISFYGIESFQTRIKANTWQENYPMYSCMLSSKLSKAERRKKLLDDVELIFYDVMMLLPQLCEQKIFGFFTDQELRRLSVSLRKI